MRSAWPRLGLLLLALAPGLAAGEDPVTVGDEITVRTRRAEADGDPTASATVVDAGRFAGEAKGVAELVATAPGVTVHGYGGLGQLATVSLRGSSADQVQVLLDGLPLSGAAGGGVDLSSIPRGWVERIEVIRGAEGAHYGAGALGGVVNVITRPAVAGTWSASGTGGSFTTGSVAGDLAIGGEGWAVLGALSGDASRGRFGYLFDPEPALAGNALVPAERDHNGFGLLGGLVKGRAQLGGSSLDGLLQISAGSRDLPGWPYALTPTDGQDEARVAGVLRLARYELGPGLSASAQLSGRLDRLATRLASLGPDPVRQRDLSGALGTRLSWQAGPSLAALHLSAGMEQLAADGVAGVPVRPTLAAALSEELTLLQGRLRLAPAGRAEWLGDYSGFSGKLGATWRAAGPVSLRASAGRTFRAPSFAELYLQQGILQPNRNLVPETGISGDGGVVVEGPLGLVSLGGYSTLYRELIIYEPASFQRLKPFNDGKAVVRGVEAEAASAPLWLGFSGALAYTFMDSQTLRGDDTVLGKDLPHRPRHRLYGRLGWEGARVAAHLEAQYLSAQWQDRANIQPIPAAVSWNAGASLGISRRPETRLALEVKNLTDDRTLTDGFGNPLPGRMVLLTLTLRGAAEGSSEP